MVKKKPLKMAKKYLKMVNKHLKWSKTPKNGLKKP
jgi:hypothetical protein